MHQLYFLADSLIGHQMIWQINRKYNQQDIEKVRNNDCHFELADPWRGICQLQFLVTCNNLIADYPDTEPGKESQFYCLFNERNTLPVC